MAWFVGCDWCSCAAASRVGSRSERGGGWAAAGRALRFANISDSPSAASWFSPKAVQINRRLTLLRHLCPSCWSRERRRFSAVSPLSWTRTAAAESKREDSSRRSLATHRGRHVCSSCSPGCACPAHPPSVSLSRRSRMRWTRRADLLSLVCRLARSLAPSRSSRPPARVSLHSIRPEKRTPALARPAREGDERSATPGRGPGRRRR